jgi:hypothetical protein
MSVIAFATEIHTTVASPISKLFGKRDLPGVTNYGTSDVTEGVADDFWTIVAVAAIACMLQSVLHEGLGHGGVAYLSGAHFITVSTVAMNADIDSRWIDAAGTLVNLAAGAVFWMLLRWKEYSPVARFFLVIAMAGNLFTGTGYFLFSGVANFGDWAAVIHGWEPRWAWRVGLIVLGAVTYYAAMLLVASELKGFRRGDMPRRIRALAWTPYITEVVVGTLGGLLNPAGWFYVVASAIPATMGANAGMLSLPGMVGCAGGEGVTAIRRDWRWIGSAAALVVSFIFVVGRGLTWHR